MATARGTNVGQQIASLRQVLASDARSLEVLRDIEATVDTLAWYRRRVDSDADFVESTVDLINRSADVLVTLDADGAICASLEDAQRGIETFRAEQCERREAARRAPELREDDGVVDAYDEVIEAAARLHDAINTVRWCIMEHDADLERGQPRTSFDASDFGAMFAGLRAS